MNYEDTITNHNGANELIDILAKSFGVKANCPKPNDENYKQPEERPPYELDRDYHDWITQNIDWEQEARIGYHPPSSTTTTATVESVNISY